ncbi:hypothetical protein NKJ55_20170 [Mesorhizobium sp. M0106]|uniref:hypothetical protein n=1 Tax=Mesorhizobium sp. M0106 TaxID=2956880 RepID=UPI00333C8A2C
MPANEMSTEVGRLRAELREEIDHLRASMNSAIETINRRITNIEQKLNAPKK